VHKGKDLGERCLLSLAFFIERMEYRTKRFSAPSPDFYRIIGQRTFHNEGLTDLSEHFYQWEAFLGEHLTAS
jgi:hypothetical protein